MEQWINQQLRARLHDTLSEPRTQQRGYIEKRYVEVLLDEHERGRRDHAAELWALFVLELWQRTFIDQARAVSKAGQESANLVPAIA